MLEAARKKLGLDKIVGTLKNLMKRREKRVSSLQEPGEAMGGGPERRLKEEAANKLAQDNLDKKRDELEKKKKAVLPAPGGRKKRAVPAKTGLP
ncbi:MAG: hypothetical protein A3J79_08645 [Elusimicrobia bacterium RIFOXYB2_FULL_62_6]|nr:MAG: hypothetical protein A3J79_08645 [Elusimicrobia bacterium RIFOXYB2_FULL_62_6]